MPRRFLSKAERQRLSQFPDEVTEADCIVYFTLTPADKEFVASRRGGANRLAVALLLCSLCYLGYFPAIKHIPENVIAFVTTQLSARPQELADYADRDETRREHLPAVMQHLGFCRARAGDRKRLIAWLGERALEHDRPSTLLQQACERLYQLQLVRPAITTMEELVADARQWAQQRTIDVLAASLSRREKRARDRLLVRDREKDVVPPLWLRQFATGHSDKNILETLDKLSYLRRWPVLDRDVNELPPSRLKYLARLARYTSPQELKRKKPRGMGYAILVAFLCPFPFRSQANSSGLLRSPLQLLSPLHAVFLTGLDLSQLR